MNRRLLILLLSGILLLGAGCGSSPQPEVTRPSVGDHVPKATTGISTETEPTETEPFTSPTEPVTEATEPVTEATEPVTEATEPATEPEPTPTVRPTEPQKPTNPAKPTKPAETSKPSENTKPVKPSTPPVTTVPTETTPPETAAPTEPPEITEGTAPMETHPSQSGWVEQDGKRFYYCDGSIHTGWLKLDGNRYYFHEDGTMAVGKVQVPGGGTRYFTSTGKECILVNPWNYVPSDYSVKLSKYGDYKVADVCLVALKEMLADCKSAGNKAVVVSAYRSHSYQAGLYERRVQRFIDQGYDRAEAEIEAAKRVAIPGTSEHELGLAMDIVDVNYQKLDKKQEDTAAQKWLIAHSWKYGFILRYPNEKTHVTGIIYEPWHYRYVGKELARELHDSGLCLEEYFAQLS